MALGLPYTYKYLYSLQIQRKPTREEISSTSDVCHEDIWIDFIICWVRSEHSTPRTIYYIICFPNSLCNCVKTTVYFAVQLNAVNTHTLIQIRFMHWSITVKRCNMTQNRMTQSHLFWHFKWMSRIFIAAEFQLRFSLLWNIPTEVMTSFPLRNYYHHLSTQSMPKIGESDQLNIINFYI